MGATKRVHRRRTGSLTAARERGVELAKAGLSDDEVLAVLRHEFSSRRPYRIIRTHLALSFEGWVKKGLFADARVAGRAAALEALHKTLGGEPSRDRTQAAIQLVRRQEHLESLEEGTRRELERLMGLDGAKLAEELGKLGTQLGVS